MSVSQANLTFNSSIGRSPGVTEYGLNGPSSMYIDDEECMLSRRSSKAGRGGMSKSMPDRERVARLLPNELKDFGWDGRRMEGRRWGGSSKFRSSS